MKRAFNFQTGVVDEMCPVQLKEGKEGRTPTYNYKIHLCIYIKYMYVYFIDYEVQCSTRMRPNNCDVYILLLKNSNLTLKYLVLFIFIGDCCG